MGFETVSYEEWTPVVEKTSGLRIITRSGVVLGPWSDIRSSFYRSVRLYFELMIITVTSLLIRGWKVLEVKDEGENVAFIHSVWSSGYYHWITESLPRALEAKKKYDDLRIILPRGAYNNYRESLELMQICKIDSFPDGHNLLLKDPITTTCPKRFATTSSTVLKEVRDAIVKNVPVSQEYRQEILYVSRSQARGRKVLNEQELVEHLRTKFPINSVCFEDLNFSEQVELMQQTKILISIHGAGLSNMLFMKEGSTVVELIPKKNFPFDYHFGRNSFGYDSSYLRLADALGHSYHYIECETDAKFFRRTEIANIKVDANKLDDILGGFLWSKSSKD